MSEPEISLVIPLHNEEGNIPSLYKEIKMVFEKLHIPYEIVFVNDCSTDRTEEILKEIKKNDGNVRVIRHLENYGEAQSLSSGFLFAKGKIIVTMDGDGQNDPEDIPRLIEKLKEGYKAVSGWRVKRKEPFFTKVLPSFIANRLIAFFTGINVHDTGCGLKAYRSEVVKGITVPHGFHRFLPAYFRVKKNEVSEVRVKDRKRQYGRSHYGLSRIKEVLRDLLTFPFIFQEKKWSRYMVFISFIFFLLFFLFLLLFLKSGRVFLFLSLLSLFFAFLSRVIQKNLERVIFLKEKRVVKREEL